MNFLPNPFPNALTLEDQAEPATQMIGEHVVRQFNELNLLCGLATHNELKDIIHAFIRTARYSDFDIMGRLLAIGGSQIQQRVVRAMAAGEGRLWATDEEGMLESLN